MSAYVRGSYCRRLHINHATFVTISLTAQSRGDTVVAVKNSVRIYVILARNVGDIDRVVRIVVGLAFIAGVFMTAQANLRWLYLIGIALLATGLTQTCPLYSLIRSNTCPVKK